MRRIVLIMPDWLGPADGESALRQRLPALESISGRSEIFKLEPARATDTPEAAWLGLDPDSIELRQGPLTIAALGANPPDRSVQFHLSLMSCSDGMILRVPTPYLSHPHPSLSQGKGRDSERISAETATQGRGYMDLMEHATRLNTAKLTMVAGEGADHGLVWEEGSIEMRTLSDAEAAGRQVRDSLPEGDGEPLLRRFIDDSINLLSELPLNHERIDQGLPPLNLLWPWGQGFRERVPNLWLERGEQAWVESSSLRLAGLARLVGYRHADRAGFGRGTNVRLERLVSACRDHDPVVIHLDSFEGFRAQGKVEEMAWLTRELDQRLLAPLVERAKQDPMRLLLLAPSSGGGLGLWLENGRMADNPVPFDERALEERNLPTSPCWTLVRRAIGA